MDQDIQSQLDRAKELLQELENACNTDLQAKDVSGKTKNLAQEVLLKVRHLLDQSIYKFFEKHYLPNLSETDKKSAKVYFPIVSKKEDLKSVLGMAKMGDLETNHKDVYKFIDSVQPYNTDYSWLKSLSDLAKDKHIKLTTQTIKKENETKIGNAVHVGKGAKVSMHNCLVGNVPVNSEDINETSIEDFDPRLNVQRMTWVSFLFESTDINVLWLCKKSVEDGERIIKKVLEFV